MQDPYQAAVARLEAMAVKISRLEQQLLDARAEHHRAATFIENWEHFSGFPHPSRADTPAESQPTQPTGIEAQRLNPPKEKVAEMAIDILREAGRPLFRALLYEQMLKRGLVLHGKNPVVVLSTMLWRMSEVVPFIKGEGYWPKDDPLPGSMFDPADMPSIVNSAFRHADDEVSGVQAS